MIGHFSAEELASYRAGAIGADRAARISAHLADCARCAGVDSDLAGVSALLADVPVPPMPDRLTERVQAAIAAESQRRAAGLGSRLDAGLGAARTGSSSLDADLAGSTDGMPPQTGRRSSAPVSVPGRPDLPERSRRRRSGSRRSIWTSPLVLGGLAAAGVFAVVVIGIGFTQGLVGPESTAGSQPAKTLPRPEPRAPAGGTALHPNKTIGAPAGLNVAYGLEGGRTRNALVYASTKDFTRGNIGASVRSAVSSAGTFSTINGPDVSASSPKPAPHKKHPSPAPPKVGGVSVGQIAACLSAVAVSNGVLIVEVAHYQGKPAIIIVSRPVGNFYRVTVAGLACSASRPDVLARITVPRTR